MRGRGFICAAFFLWVAAIGAPCGFSSELVPDRARPTRGGEAEIDSATASGHLPDDGNASRHASCPVLDGLVRPGELALATNPTLPPLQYVEPSGVLAGLRIDLGNALARKLCLRAVYHRASFAQLTLGLLEKRWDVIDTGMFFTRYRATLMTMVPYELQAISVSMQVDDTSRIQDIAALSGHSVGVEMGGMEEAQARATDESLRKSGRAGLDIKTFQNVGIAFAALRAGQVAAVLSIDAVAQRNAEQGGVKPILRGLFPTPVALAFRDPGLARLAATVLEHMRVNGELLRLMAPYGVAPFDHVIMAIGPDMAASRSR